jgi:hypothetical protein
MLLTLFVGHWCPVLRTCQNPQPARGKTHLPRGEIMDRRFANFTALTATLLAALSLHVHGASTQCGPDATTLINGKVMPVMAAVESSASTRATDDTKAVARIERGAQPADKAQADKTQAGKVQAPVEVAQVTNPATAGGGVGGTDDGVLGDGGSAPGAHKRGLRWQSFLPGVIR